jgi:predicted O-methyltransferase YrrM
MKKTHEIDGWFNYEDVFQLMLNNTPSSGVIVECGAWLGKSSSYLCDITKNKNINVHIVDTWKGSANEMTTSHVLATHSDVYQLFLDNMGDRKFNPIQKDSLEASKDFADESCDAIFIDMDHSYESVINDIKHWWPKLKVGGIFAGHDYQWEGVNKAVNEFFVSSDIIVSNQCWIILKKEEK